MLKQEFKASRTFWNKYNVACLHKQKKVALQSMRNVAFGWSTCRLVGRTCLNVLHSLIERPKYNMLASGPSNVAGCEPSILDLLAQSYTNFSGLCLLCLRKSQVVSALTVCSKASPAGYYTNTPGVSMITLVFVCSTTYNNTLRTDLNLEDAISQVLVDIQGETDLSRV